MYFMEGEDDHGILINSISFITSTKKLLKTFFIFDVKKFKQSESKLSLINVFLT